LIVLLHGLLFGEEIASYRDLSSLWSPQAEDDGAIGLHFGGTERRRPLRTLGDNGSAQEKWGSQEDHVLVCHVVILHPVERGVGRLQSAR
jgi:hypothetical protein